MIKTKLDLKTALEELQDDEDAVVRLLVQDAIDTLREARPVNWKSKVDEAIKYLIDIYNTDNPVSGIDI